MHDLPLLLTIAVALAYALVGGVLATRVGLPSIVGYLLAGVAIGPFTPGYVANQGTIAELAELGVIFLMFGVGLHFSLRDLWRVRTIAVPGASLQMAVATVVGYALARRWGWSADASLMLGLAISVSSTVVLLRALMDRGELDSIHGRVGVGWLVLEDIATVTLLVLLPLLLGPEAGGQRAAMPAILAVGRAALFVALMLLFGSRLVPWLLRRVVRLGSHELFVLAALTIALGTALASAAWFGVSLALGAFVAGVVVSDSPYTHQINAELLSFRDTFAVLFFVSVGMLVNPVYLLQHWQEVLALSAVIVIGKAVVSAGVGFLFPYPAKTALIVGAGTSQIGEFSFIVGQTGVALGVLDAAQYSLILAGAIVSITANSFMFSLVDPLERLLQRRPRLWRRLNGDGRAAAHPEQVLRDHVVIVGSGRVGHHLAEVLGRLDIPRLVIDSDWQRTDELGRAGVPALFGDAASSTILEHAALARARALVVTVPDDAVSAMIVAGARAIAPDVPILARGGTDDGARQLRLLGAAAVVRPEFEGGLQILRSTLLTLGFPSRRIQAFTDEIRARQGTDAHDDGLGLVRQLAASDVDLEWLEVDAASRLADTTIAGANLRGRTGVSIVALEHGGVVTGNPGPEVAVAAGDRVAVIGTPAQIAVAGALLGGAPPDDPADSEPGSASIRANTRFELD